MKHSILIAVVFLLTSCVTQQRYIPQSFQVVGDYKQLSSGITFPEFINGFKRSNIIKFDEQGTNIGVGYNHPINQIALTLYAYPSQEVISIGSPQYVIDTAKMKLFNDSFERSKQDIINAHKNSQLIVEEPYNLKKYEPHYGKHAIFKYTENFAGKYQDVISHLYLIQIQNELYKYRVTYPKNRDNEKDVSDFIETFDLHKST